jgi:hypothetical protein
MVARSPASKPSCRVLFLPSSMPSRYPDCVEVTGWGEHRPRSVRHRYPWWGTHVVELLMPGTRLPLHIAACWPGGSSSS